MEKAKFRKNIKNQLNKELKFKAKSTHYKMLKPLLNLLKELRAKRILIFNPLPIEPNLYILKQRLAKKYEIFIPFMFDISLKMVKSKLPLKPSKFGVKEPVWVKFFDKRIDVAVVPVLGVDGNMARIGHGKGFYDRFFNDLPYRPIVIFVQIKENFIDKIITQNHDIQGDFYITPTKIYMRRGTYDRSFNRLRSRCGGSWRRVSCR
ncbi:5-formyltetrahydrofolate cyclo-ligase [Campylobacter sp.]|uniref:5-formyltetrahydrofolate cyclo-ligase n=1 Tax=Campylobacter sp. TaxID=205 RepID=UPI0027011B61|nr:5-formyltetrahydrofolate cyclo-ligase [Campylobacter sp.]